MKPPPFKFYHIRSLISGLGADGLSLEAEKKTICLGERSARFLLRMDRRFESGPEPTGRKQEKHAKITQERPSGMPKSRWFVFFKSEMPRPGTSVPDHDSQRCVFPVSGSQAPDKKADRRDGTYIMESSINGVAVLGEIKDEEFVIGLKFRFGGGFLAHVSSWSSFDNRPPPGFCKALKGFGDHPTPTQEPNAKDPLLTSILDLANDPVRGRELLSPTPPHSDDRHARVYRASFCFA